MKRILGILSGYLGLGLIVSLCAGFLHKVDVELLSNAAFLYKLYTGLGYFLKFMTPMMLSGFFVGCAIQFGRHPEGSVSRFSQAMFRRYKQVMIVSLILTAIITFSVEVFSYFFSSFNIFIEYFHFFQNT